MLITCPECELQVSDRAFACPHCGYPMVAGIPVKTKSKKHKRLPNGFGQISEMKGHNLRNKFRAMVTVGKTETGRPIVKALKPQSYFATYNEAYAALAEYNKNPYDLDDDLKVKELYEKWTDEYFAKLKSRSSERTIKSAWSYCSSVSNMRVRDIRARHIKGCMDEGTTPNIKSRIKSLFNLMLDYALEYELVDRNYARTFAVSDDILREQAESKRNHIPFTDKELELLWQNISMNYVDVILIQCYSGWRPQELGLLKLENINLEEGTMIGGMKTEAGTNRVVPIHPKIKALVTAKYQQAVSLGSDYLINCTDSATHRTSYAFTYDKYKTRFAKICIGLGLNVDHRPHDGRVTFVTLAKKFDVDEYAIKYMVGHAINDLTENTYTSRDTSWLVSEIEKIK